jgi:tetratricopeptide (TPR) repeat protein
VVANLFVLNAAIVEPARRILWHSDRIQPFAPFGSYIPIAIGDDAELPAPIPASPRLATDTHAREAAAIDRVRAARNARHVAGDLERSLALWELAAADPGPLDPANLAIDHADSLLEAGRHEQAAALLKRAVGDDAGWDDRIHAALLLGVCADAAGERERAVARYTAAIALIEARPEFTAYAKLRAIAERGRTAPLAAADFELSLWVTNVPP